MARNLDVVPFAPVANLFEVVVGVEFAHHVQIVAAHLRRDLSAVEHQRGQVAAHVVALHLLEGLEELRRPGDAPPVVAFMITVEAVDGGAEVLGAELVVFLVHLFDPRLDGVMTQQVHQAAVATLARFKVEGHQPPLALGRGPGHRSRGRVAFDHRERIAVHRVLSGKPRRHGELEVLHAGDFDAAGALHFLGGEPQAAHAEVRVALDGAAGQPGTPRIASLSARPFVLVNHAEQETVLARGFVSALHDAKVLVGQIRRLKPGTVVRVSAIDALRHHLTDLTIDFLFVQQPIPEPERPHAVGFRRILKLLVGVGNSGEAGHGKRSHQGQQNEFSGGHLELNNMITKSDAAQAICSGIASHLKAPFEVSRKSSLLGGASRSIL